MLASYNDPNLFLEAFHFSADDSQAFPGTMTYPKRGPSSTPCFQQYHSLSHSRNPSTASSNYSYPSDTHSAASSPYMSSYTSTHYLQPPSMQQEHLPTPTHTPTSQDFAINDTPRSNGQYQDSKPTSTPGGNAYGRYPRSNASNQSVQASDLPVTPQTVNSDDFEHYQPSFAIVANDQQNVGWGQQTAFPSASTFHSVPKLDRTISDIYADELYQPVQPQQQQPQIQQQQFNQSYLNPPQQFQSQVMQKALRLADQARSQSPNSEKSRDFSPFRQSSPYALNTASYQPHIQTAASTRQHQRQMAAGQAMSQYRAKREESHPTTISPKDALLDYHEPDESSPSLFPEASSQQSNMSDAQNGHQNNQTQFQPPSSDFQFATPGMPVSAQNDSKFQPPHFGTQGSSGSLPSGLDFPAHMATMESSRSESADEDEDDEDDDEDQEEDSQDNYEEFVAVQRPAQTNADTGTYTCTYHGCRERFTSPMLLQKHKREDHRSTAPGTHHSSSPAIGQTNQQTQMTQAGPHRCDRINPQTGKPCNSVFSRPYDLTRHEDTIHNRAKAKVRCHLCTEEKTFSRNDALTRHMKVVHPDVPWPSKHKRRR